MEKINSKWVLAETDGYDITQTIFDSYKECHEAMSDQYKNYEPEEFVESCEEMSHCNDTDAILYCNNENVYVWNITEVKFQ